MGPFYPRFLKNDLTFTCLVQTKFSVNKSHFPFDQNQNQTRTKTLTFVKVKTGEETASPTAVFLQGSIELPIDARTEAENGKLIESTSFRASFLWLNHNNCHQECTFQVVSFSLTFQRDHNLGMLEHYPVQVYCNKVSQTNARSENVVEEGIRITHRQ
jgi:hypothetical protein